MPVQLLRTLSSAQPEDDHDHFRRRSGRLLRGARWDALREKHIVVVLGEAGIGKTTELQLEAQRLRSQKQHAFFVPLDSLTSNEAWDRVLLNHRPQLRAWEASDRVAHFFLDAVDEARLRSHADFEQALSVVHFKLHDFMHRVRIVISSRPPDWSMQEVRSAVQEQLCQPMSRALAPSRQTSGNVDPDDTVIRVQSNVAAEQIHPTVLCLDPLSVSEARKLASAFEVDEENAFWNAVDDGGYLFMATRPRDLKWMVQLWNEQRSLGSYRDLIESNVRNRLTEFNSKYVAAGAVLSVDRLREGAEMLAVASELTGRAYFSAEPMSAAAANEVIPATILPDWKPDEITILLNCFLFDEAAFSKMQFHDRSTRAYLAACWVHRQAMTGAPLGRLLALFAASPFGTTVLIPARRWALSWLATINVATREWLVQHFPEMLVFDGDPQTWDVICADRAFVGYITRIANGLSTDWGNSESELRRIARRLSKGLVANLLSTPTLAWRAVMAMLPLVADGQLDDCADAVFSIYKRPEAPAHQRRCALETLQSIAGTEHRAAIEQDLLGGQLQTNELTAAALPVARWQQFSVEQLTGLLRATKPEEEYSTGPMARSVKERMLPATGAASAALLLEAVLKATPYAGTDGEIPENQSGPKDDRPWLLDVLPDCLARLLTLAGDLSRSDLELCADAAELLESLRDAGYLSMGNTYEQLHDLIAQHPALRWHAGHRIGLSSRIPLAAARLSFTRRTVVTFSGTDMPELIARANDGSTGVDTRKLWFTVAVDVAFRYLKASVRTNALNALGQVADSDERAGHIAVKRQQRLQGVVQQRKWNAQDRKRRREQDAAYQKRKHWLAAELENIRSASQKGALRFLIDHSRSKSRNRTFSDIDYAVIARDFSHEMASTLATGLKTCWSNAETPDPADYADGSIPWSVILALAGFQRLLDEGTQIEALTASDAARAARLAVWELNGPPSWFKSLGEKHTSVVAQTLRSWVERDAQASVENRPYPRVIETTRCCPVETRGQLLASLSPMVMDGRISIPQTLKEVAQVLRASGHLGACTTDLWSSRLTASAQPDGLLGELQWLHIWLNDDAVSALKWFHEHVDRHPAMADRLVKDFTRLAGDCHWISRPMNEELIAALVRLHGLLSTHEPPPETATDAADAGLFDHIVTEFRSRIPNILSQERGLHAHRALVSMTASQSVENRQQWLASLISTQAALEATHLTQMDPRDIAQLGAPFSSEPKSELQLLLQVLARLEEIKKSVEEGPLSDRYLFEPGMREAHLQIWLAGRLFETQSRRFTVTREEEVDGANKPDIQLGCAYGKVCVEIKPLYADCGYSANSLTATLQNQIVEKYLKGFNSRSGILVLFRLDSKRWDIPGAGRNQPFEALVEYLQKRAAEIAATSGVDALHVIGIDCVDSKLDQLAPSDDKVSQQAAASDEPGT